VRKNNQNGKVARPSAARLRCPIYTRKSTEEGLEQEFSHSIRARLLRPSS